MILILNTFFCFFRYAEDVLRSVRDSGLSPSLNIKNWRVSQKTFTNY